MGESRGGGEGARGGWGGGGEKRGWSVVHVVHVSTTYLMNTTLKGPLRFFLSATKIL